MRTRRRFATGAPRGSKRHSTGICLDAWWSWLDRPGVAILPYATADARDLPFSAPAAQARCDELDNRRFGTQVRKNGDMGNRLIAQRTHRQQMQTQGVLDGWQGGSPRKWASCRRRRHSRRCIRPLSQAPVFIDAAGHGRVGGKSGGRGAPRPAACRRRADAGCTHPTRPWRSARSRG